MGVFWYCTTMTGCSWLGAERGKLVQEGEWMWSEVKWVFFGLMVCESLSLVGLWVIFVSVFCCLGVYLVSSPPQWRYEYCPKIKSHLPDSFYIAISWRNVLEMLSMVTNVFYGATPTALSYSACACYSITISSKDCTEDYIVRGLSL